MLLRSQRELDGIYFLQKIEVNYMSETVTKKRRYDGNAFFVRDLPSGLKERFKVACFVEDKTMKAVLTEFMERFCTKVERRDGYNT
jgi:hypothetical protein